MFNTYEDAIAAIKASAAFDDYVFLQKRENGTFALLNWNPEENTEVFFRGNRIK